MKSCINESLNSLKQTLEKYYAVLPLPELSEIIQNALPKDFREKRKYFQKINCLLEDKDDKVNNK